MEKVIWVRRQNEREEIIMPREEGACGESRGNVKKNMKLGRGLRADVVENMD